MPIPKACLLSGPGCSDNGVAVPGKSRCRAHDGAAWSRVDPESKHRYDAAWRMRRAMVLREQPHCAVCGAPATDVDHIIAVADGGTDDRANRRGLCAPCHRKHTADQNRARRKKGKP